MTNSFTSLVNNIVVLNGSLSSDPVWRELASGSTAVTLEVTTDSDDGPRRSAPVTVVDPRRVAELEKLKAGSDVVVIGEVRRRFFRGANGPGSRTEVVAHEVVPAGQRGRVERHIAEVRRVLGTLVV